MNLGKIKQDLYYKTRYKAKLRSSIKISDKKMKEPVKPLKAALHFHVFYVDLLEEIYGHLKSIKNPFTLFITVVKDEDFDYVNKFFESHEHAFELKVLKVENKGRDIYPFYLALHDCYKDYDIIGHFHTKKSLHSNVGDYWRKYLYGNLLGNNCLFDNILAYFAANEKVGFVTTPIVSTLTLISSYFFFKDNNADCKKDIEMALNVFGVPTDALFATKENLDFPCGNMFIARTDAVKQFFATELSGKEFPDEKGQLNGTLQHFVELIWKYVVSYNGYDYKEVIKH